MLGMAVFVAACAGGNWAFLFSPLSVVLGGVGLLLALVGGLFERNRLEEDTAVLAAFFACALSLAIGLLEMAAWLGWRAFPK